METTTTERPRRPRTRASVRADADQRDAQYDLLTAALLGAMIGAGATLLLRRGPAGYRPVTPMLRGAAVGARTAGRAGARGARWVGSQAEDMWDSKTRRAVERHLRDYVSSARDRIDSAVNAELQDLRKTLRRQRRRLGV
jgi:predicted RNA-binding protein YlxR (DUF448 family)